MAVVMTGLQPRQTPAVRTVQHLSQGPDAGGGHIHLGGERNMLEINDLCCLVMSTRLEDHLSHSIWVKDSTEVRGER